MNKLMLSEQIALNAICPYFTMFPIDFPLEVLRKRAGPREVVLDPFCGRGTTNFAARILGLSSVGIDSSPIAIAATAAKLVNAVQPHEIIVEAKKILSSRRQHLIPAGRFWAVAYRPSVLTAICKLRAALLEDCRSDKRKALRGLVLGALHGPLRKNGGSSYFSNQAPRTYAPKPRYAISFWEQNGYRAPDVDVLEIIEVRSARYYGQKLPHVRHRVKCGDSRNVNSLRAACADVVNMVDGFHPDWQCGIEVEAGRAWMGNAVYRDLI